MLTGLSAFCGFYSCPLCPFSCLTPGASLVQAHSWSQHLRVLCRFVMAGLGPLMLYGILTQGCGEQGTGKKPAALQPSGLKGRCLCFLCVFPALVHPFRPQSITSTMNPSHCPQSLAGRLTVWPPFSSPVLSISAPVKPPYSDHFPPPHHCPHPSPHPHQPLTLGPVTFPI